LRREIMSFAKLCLWLCAIALSAETVREVHYQGFIAPTNTGPSFDHGYLFTYEEQNKFSLYAKDGSLVYTGTPEVPAATSAFTQKGSPDSDGSLAIAVQYRIGQRPEKQGGIALFDSAGKQERFIRTGEFVPTQVCFAEDHSLWAVGEIPRRTIPDSNGDYPIVRHYSKSGEELGSALARSSFSPDDTPIAPVVGQWGIRASKDRIGIFAGHYHGPSDWIETDFGGKELGRWKAADLSPLAFTSNGKVYALGANGVVVLDHASGTWKPAGIKAKDGHILGADHDSLVVTVHGTNSVRWVDQPVTD
jgi:hypothetical protein